MAYGVLLGQRPKTGLGAKVYLTAYQDTSSLTNVTATGQNTGRSYTATYNATAQAFIFSIDVYDTYTFSGVLDGSTLTQTAVVNASKKIDVVLGPVLSSTLNDNSWAAIRYAADNDLGESVWAVGDAKQITLNGTVGVLTLDNYQPYVYILGFNHNADLEGQNMIHFGFGATALNSGTNIALVDSQYNTIENSNGFRMYTNQTNNGGWQSSYMRQTIINANATSPTSGSTNSFLAALPSDLQAVLKQCNKYTDNVGNGTGNIQSNVTSTQDWMFLLSEYEVIGYISFSNTYEQNYQKQYQYYIDGNSKIKHKHNDTNTQCVWWIRSLMATSTVYFCIIGYPNPDGYRYSNYSFGFAPAFCI